MSEVEAGADRADYIESAMRALAISGRQLVRLKAGWGVMRGTDRRLRTRFLLEDSEVKRLVAEGRIAAAGEDVRVLTDVRVEAPPPIEPWAFIAAGRRDAARSTGTGFAALATAARKGQGPLTMRHVNAGLRLIADAERRDTSKGLTMDWDSGPVDRQRRSGVGGGFAGGAAQAAKRLRRVSGLVGKDVWKLAWAVCVDAVSLRTLQARFGLAQRDVRPAVAEALEAVALAYDS
ncbi:MAG: DUF6456 domain-containing protein [Hyphomonadaceae bacterium]|nr:DUF6456 domain-containing protein [Hyphomonadaceae bacterium]